MTPKAPIKPGQIYFDIKAMDGWRYIKVLQVLKMQVRVEFLEPKSYWGLATGLLDKKEILTRYELADTGI